MTARRLNAMILSCFSARAARNLRAVICALATLTGTISTADAQRARSRNNPAACTAAGGEQATIATADNDGALTLSDGRSLRIAGLDLGRDAVSAADWNERLERLRALLSGKSIVMRVAPPSPDRWGRLRMFAQTAEPDGSGIGLHTLLLEAGLARIIPADGADGCLSAMLAAEIKGRRQAAVLWQQDGFAVIDATRTEPLRTQTGRFAIVEGRVLNVGERTTRTWLNFGRFRSRGFSVAISSRSLVRLRSAGILPSSFNRMRIRVRGVVSGRRAPTIEVFGPEQIERLDEAESSGSGR